MIFFVSLRNAGSVFDVVLSVGAIKPIIEAAAVRVSRVTISELSTNAKVSGSLVREPSIVMTQSAKVPKW